MRWIESGILSFFFLLLLLLFLVLLFCLFIAFLDRHFPIFFFFFTPIFIHTQGKKKKRPCWLRRKSDHGTVRYSATLRTYIYESIKRKKNLEYLE